MKYKTHKRNRKTDRKRTRRGGKKLGEGAFGYVVSPGIPCEGKNPNTYVSKIFKDKTRIAKVKERRFLQTIAAKLKEIDPNQEYFLYPELCETYGPLSDVNKADKVTEDDKEYSYMMKLGGPSLDENPLIQEGNAKVDEVRKEQETGGTFRANKLIADYEETAKANLDKYIKLLLPIVSIIDKLSEAGYRQNDIHGGNFVYMEDGKPRMIDFESVRTLKYDRYHTKEQQHWIQIHNISEIAPYAELYPNLNGKLYDALKAASTYKGT